MTQTDLGTRIREARERVGLSQEQVAEWLCIPRSSFSRIESGERRVDSLELQRLADLLGRSLDWFFEQEEKDNVSLRADGNLSPEAVEDLRWFGRFCEEYQFLLDIGSGPGFGP